MKKLLTSMMVLAAAFTAAAQDFTVTGLDNATYADGDEVNIGYVTSSFGPGFYDWNPELTVTINQVSGITGQCNLTVTAELAEDSKQYAGNFAQFCSTMTQTGEDEPSCTPLESTAVTKTGSFALNSRVDLGIEALIKALPATPVKVNVTISSSAQTVNLTVNFLLSEQTGIDAPEVSANSVTALGRTVNYNLIAPAQFTLYNISGRAMVNRRLAAGTGSMDLAGLPAGVYVYRCGELTGKLLLK